MKQPLCGWVTLTLLLSIVRQAQADYIYTTLDVPSAGLTACQGINDSGQIVGVYAGANGIPQSFLYSGGQFTTLAAPTDSNHWTEAWGINNSGQVVGAVLGFSIRQPVSGFLYSGGAYTILNRPGATSTSAYGINDAGQIVGNYSFTTSGFGPGFLFSGGKYTAINYPGASYTVPYGINNAGQIVGEWSTLATAGSFLLKGYPERNRGNQATLPLFLRYLNAACR
jgi:probable HAF family extracellular repeat protein